MMFLRFIACVLLLVIPTEVMAQTVTPAPLQAVPPGDDSITAVQKGTPAPVTGQLFDQPTAIRWGNYLQQCKMRLVSDVMLQQKVDEAQIDYLLKTVDLERTKYTTVVTDYQTRLTAAQNAIQNPPFYKTPLFGFTLGVLGSLLIGGLAAWLVVAVKP
jgi:hypothetical protein